MKIVPMFVIFQLVTCLRTNFGNVEAVDRLQIRKKNISQKGSSVENIGRFEFWKEQKTQ